MTPTRAPLRMTARQRTTARRDPRMPTTSNTRRSDDWASQIRHFRYPIQNETRLRLPIKNETPLRFPTKNETRLRFLIKNKTALRMAPKTRHATNHVPATKVHPGGVTPKHKAVLFFCVQLAPTAWGATGALRAYRKTPAL